MVYGFVRQSGGGVRIHSQVGLGTSVKLYLPATDAEAAVAPAIMAPSTARGDGQRVLVVEDDAAVRLLVREVLQEQRYDTVEHVQQRVELVRAEKYGDLQILLQAPRQFHDAALIMRIEADERLVQQ